MGEVAVMSANSGVNYNDVLKKLIPNLDRYSFLCGTEGKVYFVGGDFVVKTYFEPVEDLAMFNEFCKEIKSFGDAGYAVPRIYSWASVPCKTGKNFETFILEEKIKGKTLFDLDVSRLYDVCKKFCTREEFEFATASKKNNPELLGLVMREHIAEYLATNNALNLLPDAELERFISTDYELGINSRFSGPDVQAGNVMFDGKSLTVIDNAYLGRDKGEEKPESVKATLIRDMFLLFYYNESVNWMPWFRCTISSELNKMKTENMETCFTAMRRFVRKANQMYNPVLTNVYDYEACKMVAYEVFEKKLADEICSEVQKGF